MRRLSAMSRDELEKEARTAFDLNSHRAAKTLDSVSEELLRSILKMHRKGEFDASPFFDRNAKRWTVRLEELKRAVDDLKPQSPRRGWSEERRAKTMATRAANKAAREKEINDLKERIVELENLLAEKDEEIWKLKTATVSPNNNIREEIRLGFGEVFKRLAETFSENPKVVEEEVVEEKEISLEEMTTFELNKKAAELGMPAGINKDRLIKRIRSAVQ